MQGIKTFLIVLFLLLLSGSLHAETLRIAVHEFCPYLCDPVKENGKEGYVAEILKAVYEPAGYTLEFHRVPYVRGIRNTERGTYDGMPMLNPQSSKTIVLSQETCGILVQNFYVKKGNTWRYINLKSLENIKIGSIIGYNYSTLDQGYEAYLRKYSNTTPKKVFYAATKNPSLTNLKLILKGRITTFNECSYVVDYILSKENLIGEFSIAGTLGVLNNYMGISPRRPDAYHMATLFDEGIRELRFSGRLNTILSRYGLTDWANQGKD